MDLKHFIKFLCHQKPERSYKFCKAPLLVCSRCLGIYIGFFVSFLALLFIYGLFTKSISIYYAALFFVPMAIDGFTQLFRFRESNNALRFITGYIAGLGTAYLVYAAFAITFFSGNVMGTLPTFYSLASLIFLPVFMYVLKKYNNSNNYFLRNFFNFVAAGSVAFLVFAIIVLYFKLFLNHIKRI